MEYQAMHSWFKKEKKMTMLSNVCAWDYERFQMRKK